MITQLTFTDYEPKSFDAARQAFLAKTPVPNAVFNQLETDARTAAFSIARVEAMRSVMRARATITRVIDGGLTLREGVLELQKQLADGDFSRGTLDRLQATILQNTALANAEARITALKDPAVVEEFPFWQYMTVGDGTPLKIGVRPSHAALHGLVFRHDDPFWDSHMPPWEFRCRCYIIPLRSEDVQRNGLTVQNLDFVRKDLEVKPNPNFGVPRGIGSLTQAARAALNTLDSDLRQKIEDLKQGDNQA